MSDAFINGVCQREETLQQLERQFGLRIPPGRYWYDRVSGCAGLEGQPASAVLPVGLNLGGPLSANASNGTTGVFLNGRQLTLVEVTYLMGLTGGPILPGRYWLDAQGNAGLEGGPALVNLLQLASGSGGQWSNGDGTWTWRSRATGCSASGDGQSLAVFGPEGMICNIGD